MSILDWLINIVVTRPDKAVTNAARLPLESSHVVLQADIKYQERPLVESLLVL